VLRRIFGSKRDEVMGWWRKLHNEELHNLYFSPSKNCIMISRRMGWVGHVARIGKKTAYGLLVGKPEVKRTLARPRRRWLDNIKIYLVERGFSELDCTGLAQHRYLVMNLQVP
jgi:hypothetical protein